MQFIINAITVKVNRRKGFLLAFLFAAVVVRWHSLAAGKR